MNPKPSSSQEPGADAPEYQYPGLYELSSIRLPYVPIFRSEQPGESPEYSWEEVVIEATPHEFRLSNDFPSTLSSGHFLGAEHSAGQEDHFGKCRFLAHQSSFAPSGIVGRLKINLEKTNYLDYLRSGELLDLPIPTQPSQTFRDKYAPPVRSLREFADWGLTNICGVGIFLITSDNYLIVSKHSKGVAVFPDVMTYSASGTMDWNRIDTPFTGHPSTNPAWLRFLNPFTQIARETKEELNHKIDPEHVRLFGLGIDTKKLYFQFSFYERTNQTAREVLNLAPGGRDHFMEIDELIPVPFLLREMVDLIKNQKWEPAGQAALLSLCARQFGMDRLEREIDPAFVTERWKKKMLAEWTNRAGRRGEAAVMSLRYPQHRQVDESQRYIDVAMNFIGNDAKGRDVIEFGCGIGRFSERLVSMADRLTCVDLSEAMIAKCKERLGPAAANVLFINAFGQDYRPGHVHGIAVCSLVLIHNVDDVEFHRMTQTISASADTIFLFEHVDEPLVRKDHTRIRRKEDLIAAFRDFAVMAESSHMLCDDHIIFLKLGRKGTASSHLKELPGSQASPSQLPKPEPKPNSGSENIDVFLSHNSKDKDIVKEVARQLQAKGLQVWLDEWELVPGQSWLTDLENAIERTKSAAVFVGSSGLGQWERPEKDAFLQRAVENKLRLIPVLLPGTPHDYKLPVFLRHFTWVDMRAGVTEAELDRLVWGINGKKL